MQFIINYNVPHVELAGYTINNHRTVGAEFQSIINRVWLLMDAALCHVLITGLLSALPTPEGCGPFRHGSTEGSGRKTPGGTQEVGGPGGASRDETRRSCVSYLVFITVSTPPLTCEPPSISATPHQSTTSLPPSPPRPHCDTKHPTPRQPTKHWHRWDDDNVASQTRA